MEVNTSNHNGSYVEWGAVFAGAVLAVAFSSVLLQFGTVLGVADITFLRAGENVTAQHMLMAGIFVLIVQILASMIGGYVAGRMRAPIAGATEHEKEIRDGLHGVLAWGTATIIVMIATAAMAFIAAFHQDAANAVETVGELANRQHNINILLAFSTAATSLVSAVASWVTGTKGGDHRDNQLDYSRYVSFRIVR